MNRKQQKNAGRHGGQQQAPYGAPGGYGGWEGPGGGWQPSAPAVPTPEPSKSWFARHKVLSGLGATAVVIVGISVATAGGGGEQPAAAAAQTSAAAHSSVASAPAPAGNGSGQSAAPASAPTQKPTTKAPKASAPGIGDPVRDGKFEFIVTKVERGVASVGGQYLGEKAQGSYTLVHLTVKNIGDEARSFSDSNQKVFDANGRQYEADSSADIVVTDDNNVFFEQINPGNSLKGVLVFDLPKGVTADAMELHDSMFSGGVKVQLR